MTDKKRTGKKAAASAAAYAASKKKSSLVSISGDAEAQVRDVLQGLEKPRAGTSHDRPGVEGNSEEAVDALVGVYEELLDYGFQRQHIEQALQVPSKPSQHKRHQAPKAPAST
jgi:hypothetical protein